MLTLIKPLLVNITILLSFTFNANLFFPFQSKTIMTIKQKVIYGLIGSFGALVCMMYPIETLGETHFDFRMIAIMITVLYAGILSGSIVLVSVLVFRTIVGGDFLFIGLLVSFLPFLIAAVFRAIILRKAQHRRLIGTLMVCTYMVIYILIISFYIENLQFSFYAVYFFALFCTIMALFYIIERLFAANKQIDEMVYVDKLNMVGQLAASIAHEIRNPLSTVRGFIQFMSKDTQDENLKKYSPLILDELDRTNAIITNYLQAAKPEKFQQTDIPIHTVIEESVELFKPLAAFENVVIDYQYPGSFYVRGDAHYFKQAFMNIIKNSIESIEHSGMIHVKLIGDYTNRQLKIVINDNGKGMSAEQLKLIGLPFYTTKTKGTGLGSMVTNKIIREMNGRIEYRSELQKGTEVTIILPLLILNNNG
ncbi:ATP-binding protein [Cytobacillus gottheilii]|uniref:ATP-binding protein n=1 Tax=Cytobacillus gottheilii TaxID=859144 RepID=UPI0009BBD169|nr:ATP-binding protein [Cytobacillus gottheilii]